MTCKMLLQSMALPIPLVVRRAVETRWKFLRIKLRQHHVINDWTLPEAASLDRIVKNQIIFCSIGRWRNQISNLKTDRHTMLSSINCVTEIIYAFIKSILHGIWSISRLVNIHIKAIAWIRVSNSQQNLNAYSYDRRNLSLVNNFNRCNKFLSFVFITQEYWQVDWGIQRQTYIFGDHKTIKQSLLNPAK